MVTMPDLQATAHAMVAGHKGILAADESTGTLTKRFAEIGVDSTEETRRAYRIVLFGTPRLSDFVSAVILYDETIRQSMDDGTPMPRFLSDHGLIVGIKVDRGLIPISPGSQEQVTEGLDGLHARMAEYRTFGARFAKWRAVFRIDIGQPSEICVTTNAWLLARYARICQDNGLVPIVEPEVLMNGSHGIKRCEEVTARVLTEVFARCREQGVDCSRLVLKPNMVTPGSDIFDSEPPKAVAQKTVAVLHANVPREVPGIAFLSGGQSENQATANLAEIARLGPHPWTVSFSFGRALQASALRAWAGRAANTEAAQMAILERARQNSMVLAAVH